MKVLVLGAGVIGLTTAITLAEQGHRVTVRTAEPPERTTSAAAGALWGPWLTERPERLFEWASYTLRTLTDLANQPDTGVRVVAGKDVSTDEHSPPDWFALLPDARPCTADDLPNGYAHGVRYSAPLVNMPAHLAYLVTRLRAAGGVIEHSAVDSLDEAADRAPVVVNCTGLGARALAGDDELYPIRGQHLVVTNPGVDEFLEVDTGDSTDLIAIYPHGSHLVLGGTAEPGEWDCGPNPSTAQAILTRCAAVLPILERAEVLEHRVGLRPTRTEVRLDSDTTYAPSRVIHNYGHGGAGVSLAWGCARSVATLLGWPTSTG